MSTTKCLSCGHLAYAFDNFMDLSIGIPRSGVRFTGSVKISDCLDKFVEVQRMVDTGYKCEGCKKPVDVEKNMSIFRFPKILCIHLKRFYHSAMRKEKLNTTVQYPAKELDMRKYAPHSVHQSKQNAVYNLFGIAHHSGSLYEGHYISEVLQLGDMQWYHCNDARINRINQPDTCSSSAYVLFYVMANA